MLRKWLTGAVLGCAAMGIAGTAASEEQSAPVPTGARVRFVDTVSGVAIAADPGAEAQAQAEVQGTTAELYEPAAREALDQQPGKYWIGVGCEPVSESLRSQLDIEAGTGLLVNDVMDDSPAKAAGIQPHDILLSVAWKEAKARKLTDVSDLNETVQKAESNPLSLVLLRKGNKQTIEVAPAERPKAEITGFNLDFVPLTIRHHHGDPKKVQSLLQQLQEELGGGPQGMRFQMATPVVVAAPPHATSVIQFAGNGLPDGMTLTITKSGHDPVKFEVRQGEGKVWRAKDNEIETLPAEAQGLAKAALVGLSQPNFSMTATHPGFGWTEWPVRIQPAPPQRLFELTRQLAREQSQKGGHHPDVLRLQGELEALHNASARPPAAARLPTPQEAFRQRMLQSQRERESAVKSSASTTAKGKAASATQQEALDRLQQQVEVLAESQSSLTGPDGVVALLHKQIEHLAAAQAKQAEQQQQQLRELQKALERIATKE